MKDIYRGCLMGGAVGEAMALKASLRGIMGVRDFDAVTGETHPLKETRKSLFTANALLLAETRLNDHGTASVKKAARSCYDDLRHCESNDWKHVPVSWLYGVPELHFLPVLCRENSGVSGNDLDGCRGNGSLLYVAPVGLMYEENIAACIASEVAESGCDNLQDHLSAALLVQLIHDLAKNPDAGLPKLVQRSLRKTEEKYHGTENCRRLCCAVKNILQIYSDGDEKAALQFSRELAGEEKSFAWAVFCCLRNAENFSQALAMAGKCRNPSIMIIAGIIMGTKVGLNGIPQFYWDSLPLKAVIIEVADDLCNGAFSSRKGVFNCCEDARWLAKYAGRSKKAPEDSMIC